MEWEPNDDGFLFYGTGAFIGKRLQAMHEEKGVRFVLDAEVSELRGDEDGRLTEVELTSGQTLAADLVVSGLGVVPCTDFLRDSDVRLDRRGYVPVDQVDYFRRYFFTIPLRIFSQGEGIEAHSIRFFTKEDI